MRARLPVVLMVLLYTTAAASAAEIKVFTPRALWTVLQEIGPDFEGASGHKLEVITDLAPTLGRRIEQGDEADLFVGPPFVLERLLQAGKVLPETRTPLSRSGIGMSVRAGAPKPDISTVEAFKRTLLDAKSIGYLKTGASGVYLAKLFERMGIAQAIAGKVVRPDTDIVSEMVSKGEVELGLVVTTQILTTPGVEFVGPIPSEFQSYVEWDGIITVSSKSREATKALIDFLRTPKAAEVMKRQGWKLDSSYAKRTEL